MPIDRYPVRRPIGELKTLFRGLVKLPRGYPSANIAVPAELKYLRKGRGPSRYQHKGSEIQDGTEASARPTHLDSGPFMKVRILVACMIKDWGEK